MVFSGISTGAMATTHTTAFGNHENGDDTNAARNSVHGRCGRHEHQSLRSIFLHMHLRCSHSKSAGGVTDTASI